MQDSSCHSGHLHAYHAQHSSPDQGRASFGGGASDAGSAANTNLEGHQRLAGAGYETDVGGGQQHAGSSAVSPSASNFVGRRLPTGYALPCAAGLMDTIRDHVHSWVEDQNQVLLHASQENRRNFDEHANQISALRGTIAANNRRIAELGGMFTGKCVRVCECVHV